MDVNGTRYHLLYGRSDWGSCLLAGSDQPLAALWSENQLSDLEWDVGDDENALFQPQDSSAPKNKLHRQTHPEGYSLATESPPGPLSPVSIEAGPGGRIYILDTDPSQLYSTIYAYQEVTQVAAYPLKDVLKVLDPDLGEGSSELLSILGHDFAYVAQPFDDSEPEIRRQASGCGCRDVEEDQKPQVKNQLRPCGCRDGEDTSVNGTTAQPSILYVALSDGYQAIAFQISDGRLIAQEDFYPLRRWEGKALVAANDGLAYYDFADRWIPLRVFTECFYVGQAILTTSLMFNPDLPGGPFDSDIPGCAWHRLFLDAYIPSGDDIQVRARAADDPDLLDQVQWIVQPDPYLRSGGSELPFYDPWACDSWMNDPAVQNLTGTWELLFQEVKGRYLQLELTISGNGRSTPALRALRAWYPRFSYADNYLPAIYREEPISASFLDRWLANFEGFYTNLEDKIDHVAELFDPCTVPADSLDWLASWSGLALDPHWKEDRRRFFIRHAMDFYRLRGTLQGIEISVRLYLDKQVDDSLFDPRCVGKGSVRVVERFRTRGVGCQAYDPPDKQGVRKLRPITLQDVLANAHRFTVLVPQTLSDDEQGIVQRIVALAKPAHTDFDVKRYWDGFRVGEAQLGQDTRLGDSSQFSEMVLGNASLAESHLVAPYPFDIADRLLSDRNRLGDLPPL